jgi:hypothetical protein
MKDKKTATSLFDLPEDIFHYAMPASLNIDKKQLIIAPLAITNKRFYDFFASKLAELELSTLIEHVLKGNKKAVCEILNRKPALLFEKPNTPILDYSGRYIIETPYQAILGTGDTELLTASEKYIDTLPDGYKLAWDQYEKALPSSLPNTVSHYDFIPIITHLATNDAIAFNDSVNKLREHLKTRRIIESGEHCNFQDFFIALQTYEENYFNWTNEQRLTYYCQVIGYWQRYLPTNYVQLMCASFSPNLIRHLILQEGSAYFPLDSDKKNRLGYEYAIYVDSWCGALKIASRDQPYAPYPSNLAQFKKVYEAKQKDLEKHKVKIFANYQAALNHLNRIDSRP